MKTLKLMWDDPQNKLLAVFLIAALGFGIYAGIQDGFREVALWIFPVIGVTILWFILSYFSYRR